MATPATAASKALRAHRARGRAPYAPGAQAGVSLIEVLVSIFIIAISLLGLAGLQARATNAEFESYQRTQAIVLANDMVERIRMNRIDRGYFKNISGYVGTGFPGGTGAFAGLDCAGTGLTRAQTDLCAWSSVLQGASVTNAGAAVGAVVDARGCVSYDATTEYSGVADSGVYTVAVAWQGSQETVPPALTCGQNLYGTDSKRRLVYMSFRMAKLS